jgi:spore germination protein KC
MKNKAILLISIISIMFIITSCWDQVELDDLSILSGVGIDEGTEDKYAVTMQVILHRELKIQSQTGKRGEQKPTQNILVEGDSLIEVNRNLTLQSGRVGYWSHVKVIVIGEALAEAGIENIIDIIERDPEIRQQTYLLVAKGTASEILAAESIDLEIVQAYNISDMVEKTTNNANVVAVDIHDYLLQTSTEVSAGYMTGIEKISETTDANANNIQLTDTGIFKENKLIGWFNEDETRGLLWTLGEVNEAIEKINYPTSDDTVFFKILDSNSSIEVAFTEDNSEIEKIVVSVEVEANIAESNKKVDLTKAEEFTQLETKASESIAEKIRQSIDKGQDLNADVFGFSNAINRSNPSIYKEIVPYYDAIFPAIPIEINVEVAIERTGLISNAEDE